jgi:hypothetical protein
MIVWVMGANDIDGAPDKTASGGSGLGRVSGWRLERVR